MHLDQNFLPAFLDAVPANITLHKITTHRCGVVVQHAVDFAVEVVGVSVRMSPGNGAVEAVAFATPTNVFYVDTKRPAQDLRDLMRLVDNPLCPLAGFGMAQIALHLHRQFALHVQGVDLSTLFSPSTRAPQTAAEVAAERLHPDVNMHRIHALWYHQEDKDVCLRAWLSAVLAQDSLSELYDARPVNTRYLRDVELKCLSELLMNIELLEAERPTRMETEFEQVEIDDDGHIVIRNARYNTRVRQSKQTRIVLETTHGHTVTGQAVRAEGKETSVRVVGGNFRGDIERVRVVGREESTNSELARDEFVLLLLQGDLPSSSLIETPFIRLLWFPTGKAVRRTRKTTDVLHSDVPGSLLGSLNQSQKEVVGAMWSEEDPLVIVHGPPGTGKTTTIAAALEDWDYYGDPAWVIAQSNVGVKNIARTLIKRQIDFKILVSKEFYVEWHENLYEMIESRLIRSDDLFADLVEAERKLGGSKIILSTVAMLSNPALDNCGVFRLVPVERLVVDEASQIDSFEFMHLFHKCKSLRKVCMFGDPKQLPPYGKETAPLMKTIFDFKHLKPTAYFLNTQYRMPMPLGEFISEEVYNSKLKSVHSITDLSCVRLVDVRKGSEMSVGSSWQNIEEVHAVVNIVKKYYKHLEFCVITPYDAQRAAISGRLEAEGLPSDSVYNVDSFQGHEARFVIVSTVRTTSPGFLRSLNRMNVMLTRCQEGMVFVTNRRFLKDSGRDTLLGSLAHKWTRSVGEEAWIDPLTLSDRRASLPGVPGRVDPTPFPPSMAPSSVGGGTAHSVTRDSISSLAGKPGGPHNHAGAGSQTALGSVARGRPLAGPSQPVWRTQITAPAPGVGTGVAASFLRSPTNFKLTNVSATELGTLGRLSGKTGPQRVSDHEDQYPALGGAKQRKPATLRGKWRKGSEACKL